MVKTHGMRQEPIYAVWCSMKARCLNKKNIRWPDYGGRGITVCKEWLSFDQFYKDMGDTPFKGAQIDRVENSGNYEKNNCKWSTRSENGNNKRSNAILEIKGVKHTVAEWSQITGISYKTLYGRVFGYGWPIERALNEPIHNNYNGRY